LCVGWWIDVWMVGWLEDKRRRGGWGWSCGEERKGGRAGE
jgi:hypothetical protein